MAYREIEVQVKVENGAALLTFLKEHGKLLSTEQQRDEYFTPPHRNFVESRPIKEWLRLRQSDKGISINYKNWQYSPDGKSNYADEYESGVSDVGAVQKIFEALNFRSLITVSKKRTNWEYQDYLVSFDTVEGLGDYVEIEYKGENQGVDPKETAEQMIAFLKETGCGKVRENFGGYPYQLLFPDEVKWEEY
jgi:adenylate cyclase class 2